MLYDLNQENKSTICRLQHSFDLMGTKDHTNASEFLSIMQWFGLSPTIVEPTRITVNKESGIDKIFTNMSKLFFEAWVLSTVLSDHTGQIITFYIESVQRNVPSFKRFYSEKAKLQFRQTLGEQSWEQVFLIDEKKLNDQ
ncbi:hypothetical protein HHI36_003209 [Cryptolaemus montrouzieri]|uniref:Uncharacterized protein n=1 Tax=Cryptolaemus montrouzieri TaxID=559131 RepID=A0ABD2PD87_9CUCU